MAVQIPRASAAERVAAWVLPYVRTVPATVPKTEIVDVATLPTFEREYEFVGAAIESTHACVGLAPDYEVLEFLAGSCAGITYFA